ncbi:MAG TPA: DUF3108 domain-containing protein [Pyrinomonadaceae bacterium]|nr:DUF3108 domain-containing protein [Pyrinomonadaceae bacterium]
MLTRTSVAWFVFALAVNTVLGQQVQRAAVPFSGGEELVYQAEFNKGLLRGIDVAEFRFKAETQRVFTRGLSEDDPVILRLVGDVTSKGLFPRIAGFRFHEHVESTVDPDPFTVLRTSKLEEQGKRVRASDAIFDHEAHKVTWTERDPNQTQPTRTSALEFSEPIQDILTMIYFLRTRKLEVGKSFDVPLSDSGKVFRFSVAVVERKELNTVLGRVSAVRIDPALFGENGLVRSRGSLSIWITEDSRRLPVKAQLKVDIGTFDIKLKRVSYPEAKAPR